MPLKLNNWQQASLKSRPDDNQYMAVSHVFPYPKKLLAVFHMFFTNGPKTLHVHKEKHEKGPEPYVFIKKNARRARCLFLS